MRGLLPAPFAISSTMFIAPCRATLRMAHMACDPRERRLLRGVLVEALEGQQRKRFALEQQAAAAAVPLEPLVDGDEKGAKARAKALRRAEQIPLQLAAVDSAEARLLSLRADLSGRADLGALRDAMESELGLGGRLATFDIDAHAYAQWGRPDGFDGLVVESPRGIPILVGQKKFSDEVLRRVARSHDLWFQCRDGSGSRVLLRTSMVRALTRSPRECQEAAADLAAYFSGWRSHDEEVEVMFTDSRHVAKRGTRVGQMKDSKRLGTLWARPWRVAELAREAQEEQGWLDDRKY